MRGGEHHSAKIGPHQPAIKSDPDDAPLPSLRQEARGAKQSGYRCPPMEAAGLFTIGREPAG
jgi:hypothetical protein